MLKADRMNQKADLFNKFKYEEDNNRNKIHSMR